MNLQCDMWLSTTQKRSMSRHVDSTFCITIIWLVLHYNSIIVNINSQIHIEKVLVPSNFFLTMPNPVLLSVYSHVNGLWLILKRNFRIIILLGNLWFHRGEERHDNRLQGFSKASCKLIVRAALIIVHFHRSYSP